MLSVAKWLRLRLRSQRPEFYSRLSWCFYKWIKYEIKCKHTDLYKKNILKLQHGLCVITRVNILKKYYLIITKSLFMSYLCTVFLPEFGTVYCRPRKYLGQCTVDPIQTFFAIKCKPVFHKTHHLNVYCCALFSFTALMLKLRHFLPRN